MGFQPGTNDLETGGFGFTTSNVSNGLAGRADSQFDGSNAGGSGVFGFTTVNKAAGVLGINDAKDPNGNPKVGTGVQGNGPTVGVGGFSSAGSGVLGQSDTGSGLVATSGNGQGISAFSTNDVAIFASGATWSGVFNGALVVNKGPDPDPNRPNPVPPSPINGSIVINDGSLFVNKGDVILANGDCAEDFNLSEVTQVHPGTVMVLDRDGALSECAAPYDKRVAGVISGAGKYKPGLVLDRQPGERGRVPLALIGKVYCKVDASYASIQVGDLLTTSPTGGHAMKAVDPIKAFGSVIGKALRGLEHGQAMIPILVALQ